MAAVAPFRLDKIVAGSDFTLQTIQNARPSPALMDLIERCSGERAPNWVGTDKTEPAINCSTPELAVVLGAVGVNGLAITGNTDFHRKLATQVGNVARATTSHQRIRAASTIVCWSRITLPQRGRGTVDLQFVMAYDGSNEPFVYAGSLALPGSIAASSLGFFQVGPVYINGAQITAIEDVTIESGAQIARLYADGEHHPTYNLVESVQPKYTIRTENGLGWSTISPAGLALNGSSGLVVYGRKMTQNGSRVANGTSSHLSFTSLNGRCKVLESNADGTAPFFDTIEVTATTPDDTTAVMTIATNATIP